MHELGDVFSAVVPVFLVIAIGAGLHAFQYLKADIEKALTRLVIHVFYPVFLFKTIVSREVTLGFSEFGSAFTLGFLFITIGYGVCYFFSKRLGWKDDKSIRSFIFSTSIFNYGYIPIPLSLALFDPMTTAVLAVFCVGVETAVWTLGIYFLSGNSKRSSWRKLITPPIIALLLALITQLTGLVPYFPEFAWNTLSHIGNMAVPMGLIIVGSVIYGLLNEVKWAHDLSTPAVATFCRLFLIPLILLFIGWVLPISTELKRVVAIQVAMPCGVFPIVLCKHFGANFHLAFRIVLLTTVISFITMPLWLSFALAVLC